MINQDQIKSILAFFARKIIEKYQPVIIGITGSIGKTSTRHAIAAALGTKYKLREPIKNYNNEFGIPLTIIGAKSWDEQSGFLSKEIALLKIIFTALSVWLLPQDYPKVLVLEYGIDRPGDMDKYLAIAAPQLAVITTIGISHKEFFDTEEQIAFEKGKLAAALPGDGVFVYNADDALVTAQTQRTSAHTVSFSSLGTGKADVILEKAEQTLSYPASTVLQIKTPNREIRVKLPTLGKGHEMAALAAVAVAEAMEVETDLIIKGLATYRPMPGRLNVLAGIKKSIVIDDSYNSAPLSVLAGLKLLAEFPNPYKMAVLGDMLELGDEADTAHKQVGEFVAKLNLQKLVTVGELGKQIANAAQAVGMPSENITCFLNSDQAATEILKMLQPESVIFVKGSQGARMEKISKELLAEPSSAVQFLPRQYGKWLES